MNIFLFIKKILLYFNNTSFDDIEDYMNIFQKKKKKTKYSNKYENFCESKLLVPSAPDTQILNNIPKELYLNKEQVYNLICQEIDCVNEDLSHSHYIVCNDDCSYNFNVRFRYNSDNNIGSLKNKLKLLNDKHNFDYFELSFTLDTFCYPFKPPKIDYIKPKISNDLIIAILNINNFDNDTWNYTVSLNTFIKYLGEKLESYFDECFCIETINKNINFSKLDLLLINLGQKNKLTSSKINISLSNLIQINKTSKGSKKYWNSGVGYGTEDSKTNWNINNYINKQNIQNLETNVILKSISLIIFDKPELVNNLITNNIFIGYITNIFSGVSLLEFNNQIEIFTSVINLLHFINTDTKHIDILINICNIMKPFIINIKDFTNNESLLLEIDDNLKQAYSKYIYFFETYYVNDNESINIEDTTLNESNTTIYTKLVEKYNIQHCDLTNTHRYFKHRNTTPTKKGLLKIISEMNTLKNTLPNNWGSSILVNIPKNNLNLITFTIIGPEGTPYQNGVFKFHCFFSDNYPTGPPQVLLDTTDGGRVRFNPNLYNNGKVCLSLLGTWSGEQGESWNPQISTFLQVLISIQSLIFVEHPYYNEPGYEKSMYTTTGKKRNIEYTENIRLETIKVAMLDILDSTDEYSSFIKEHFKLKLNEIVDTIDKWKNDATSELKEARYELLKKQLIEKVTSNIPFPI